MTNRDAEFLKRLLATFRVEADEHLKGITHGLLELEKTGVDTQRAEILETIFREAHSLKGAARAVNLTAIESLCQPLESVFAAMKKRDVTPSAELFDLLQEVTDFLGRMLSTASADGGVEEKGRQLELIRRLQQAAALQQGPVAGSGEAVPDSRERGGQGVPEIADLPPLIAVPRSPLPDRFQAPVMPETVRVSTARLTAVLLQSEEMLSAKLAAGQRVLDMRAATGGFGAWKKEWARILPFVRELRPLTKATRDDERFAERTDRQALERILEFVDWSSSFVRDLEEKFTIETTGIERDARMLGGMVNNLLEEMKKVLMFPFSSLLEILPKLVRDLSRDNGKEVELTVRGDEIEIDRRILEEMKDPLVHLVRNCIDHGMETPDERQRKGKPRQGSITVTVVPVSDKVELVVADDGRGIPLDELRSALLKTGMVHPDRLGELSDQALLSYIFLSGVSTSPIITELSGRGVGLAIVREKVEKLGGTVVVESSPESGTCFRMVLPLTVATFRGIIARAGERTFVIPSMSVERVVRLLREEIGTVENRETISLDNEPLSLVRLSDVLGLPGSKKGPASTAMVHVVVLASAGTRIAFLVDEVLNEQEVLLKGLGSQLSRVRNVAGATVLGSGRVVPILNVSDLLKSAVRGGVSPAAPAESQIDNLSPHAILVVEDSITTRTLLKNILESAGYEVTTAVDGVDAFARLKSASFDVVVSDVEMPRMNGFDLTAKIREDGDLAELPVILVTAMESREDRERGIDVGANAYIVKSSFDQSNLLEVLHRLL